MSFQIKRLRREHLEGAASVLVSAYGRPLWNESWSLEAATENITYVLETPKSIAISAVDDGKVLGLRWVSASGAMPARSFTSMSFGAAVSAGRGE